MSVQWTVDTTTKSSKRLLLMPAVASVLALMVAAGRPVMADEHMVRVDTIPVPGASSVSQSTCSLGTGLGAFDISFVDPRSGFYVLADRTNAAVDFFDASDDTFVGRVGGFQGVVCSTTNPATANNSKSGPDGVVIVGSKEVWAGDGDSTLKVIDIATFNITGTIKINNPDPSVDSAVLRVDEMAWDARDHILAAANNANTPPFITLVNTDTHAILGQIVFDTKPGHAGVDAQNGIEQPQWSPQTGLFYVSVPQVGPDPAQGGVAVIDPSSMKVTAVFPVQDCSPAGLALGPNHQAVIGCGAVPPAVTATQTIIISIDNGDVIANVTPPGGNDEVWFDPASQHYYLGARGTVDPSTGKTTPILGTIDARTFMFDGGAATSSTAHSVAADKFSHHVFVPIGFVPSGSPPGTDPANTDPACRANGCIAVYLPSSIDDEDLGARLAKR